MANDLYLDAYSYFSRTFHTGEKFLLPLASESMKELTISVKYPDKNNQPDESKALEEETNFNISSVRPKILKRPEPHKFFTLVRSPGVNNSLEQENTANYRQPTPSYAH
jgi:hypothetical protein